MAPLYVSIKKGRFFEEEGWLNKEAFINNKHDLNCNEERLDNMMTWPPALQTFMINLSPVKPQAEYVAL